MANKVRKLQIIVRWPETSNSPKYDPRKRPWYVVSLKDDKKVSDAGVVFKEIADLVTLVSAQVKEIAVAINKKVRLKSYDW